MIVVYDPTGRQFPCFFLGTYAYYLYLTEVLFQDFPFELSCSECVWFVPGTIKEN